MLITWIILLVLGGILLWKGADWLVDGASDIAAKFKVPPIYIGLTVVAFGTSLPELIVSLYAVLTGKPGISIGNIIGSNIANIGLIIGLTAIFYPLVVKRRTLMYEFPIMIILSFMFPLLANRNYIFGQNEFYIGKFASLVFLGAFIVFLYYIFSSVRKNAKAAHKKFDVEKADKDPLWKSILYIIIGPIALYLGGNFFVDNASKIAQYFGISELIIGLTVVSIGTSLPELFTSIAAVYKKKADIAVGNIVGSNIFNIGWVLGLVGLVKRIPFDASLVYVDSMIMMLFTLLFLLFAARSKKIKRSYGVVLFLMYVSYIVYLVLNA